MRLRLLFLLAAFCTSTVGARADTIDYLFSFTGLPNHDADFTVDIQTSGFITTTGLAPLSTPLPTSLGYSVKNFGENNDGWFAFSESGGTLFDGALVFSTTTIGFFPVLDPGNYFESTGVFAGAVTGFSNNVLFQATGSLTITDLTPQVPEPSTLVLLGTGILGLAGILRPRRFHRC